MSNVQFSKCKKCNQDEKYSVWIINDGKTKEVKCCAKQCMVPKDKK
jgi:cellulose synthase/poly-beta-1,6-N-acetylglucosamine synthase-like glycosyltransferase